jgi:hypothetical protein
MKICLVTNSQDRKRKEAFRWQDRRKFCLQEKDPRNSGMIRVFWALFSIDNEVDRRMYCYTGDTGKSSKVEQPHRERKGNQVIRTVLVPCWPCGSHVFQQDYLNQCWSGVGVIWEVFTAQEVIQVKIIRIHMTQWSNGNTGEWGQNTDQKAQR